jgi:hypothetical protein
MRIEFRKVPYTESEFEELNNGLKCRGVFKKESNKILLLNLTIEGITPVDCDICDTKFDLKVDEKISLKLHDGISESEDLDIVECQDHFADFDEIVSSEIASIRSDYHYCEKCKNTEGE